MVWCLRLIRVVKVVMRVSNSFFGELLEFFGCALGEELGNLFFEEFLLCRWVGGGRQVCS